MAFSASIKAGLFAGITLISNSLPFLYQVIGLPRLAFKTAPVSFFAVAVLRSKIHNSLPASVVLVNANFVSSGRSEERRVGKECRWRWWSCHWTITWERGWAARWRRGGGT